MNNQEIWKDIPNYEGCYEVSNLGSIRSLQRSVKGKCGYSFVVKERILKPAIDSNGYKVVSLCYKGNKKKYSIHKLVAMSFLNHKPCGHKLVVDHINNDKLDNRLNNLQVITVRENSSKDKKGYSSNYVGVFFSKNNKKWRSVISKGRKTKHLGYFKNEIDAHKAYQKELSKIDNQIEQHKQYL